MCFVSEEKVNYHHNAFIGLSAVAGFLLLVFLVLIIKKVFVKKQDKKR